MEGTAISPDLHLLIGEKRKQNDHSPTNGDQKIADVWNPPNVYTKNCNRTRSDPTWRMKAVT
jgi:hypothetical protein